MSFERVIANISILVWIFPAIRQYKTRYFGFFLLLAVSDPVVEFFRYILKIKSFDVIYLMVFSLAFIALFKGSIIRKYWILLLWPLFPLLYSLFFREYQFYQLLLNVFLISIFLKFCYDLIGDTTKNNRIDFFLVVLIFYALTLITKVDSTYTDLSQNYYYFKITNILDVIIGLFFVIFRYGNPKLILQLK